MVEVVERGELPGSVVYEVQCRNCHSKLRFKRSEAAYVSDQRDGDYLTVQCPVCSSTVTRTA
jgi:ribosomal protein S27E